MRRRNLKSASEKWRMTLPRMTMIKRKKKKLTLQLRKLQRMMRKLQRKKQRKMKNLLMMTLQRKMKKMKSLQLMMKSLLIRIMIRKKGIKI